MDIFDSTPILFGHITVMVQKTGKVFVMLLVQGWFDCALARREIHDVTDDIPKKLPRHQFVVRSNTPNLCFRE